MDFSNVSILLVEDESGFKKQTLKLLKKFHFKNVYDASNSEDGLEKYMQYSPDIVLTDYSMPVVNGLDMSKKLKELNPQLPIILLTAMDDSETIVDAINIGVDEYLFKPVKLEKLTSIIEKHAKLVLLQKNFKKEQKLLQEYKAAIDVSAAVTKTNKDRVITYVNEAFCEMSGYSQDELIGKKHIMFRHPNTPKNTYSRIWKTITNKKTWKGRIQSLKKDGTTFYEYTIIVPITDENDKIEEYISFKQDITDLYNQEQYLRKRIEKEVQKNLELHKEQEKQNLLEAKFSTIGKIAAGITHEINTPLTYTKGNLELMMQDIETLDDSVTQKQYLQEDIKTIFNGINRIATTVESMREIASHTSQTSKLNNVYSLLITALTLSYNKAKFITSIRIQDQLFTLNMDKNEYEFTTQMQTQRIEQVFIIIIDNALDALQKIDEYEERSLDIKIGESDDYIIVVIKDNAGGIDDKILPKIFDPFQSNKERGGIGIGLNVAKRIMDDHKGKIVPLNHENGAQFNIFIPKISIEMED